MPRQAPLLLLLRDQSTAAAEPPVGMYLHSRRVGLFGGRPGPAAGASQRPASPAGAGAVIPAGTVIRFANVRVRLAPPSTGIPPRLLPTAEMVALARDRADAAAILRGLLVSGVAQVLLCPITATGDQQMVP